MVPLQMLSPPAPSFLNSTFVNVDSASLASRRGNSPGRCRHAIRNGDWVRVQRSRSSMPGACVGETVRAPWWHRACGGTNTARRRQLQRDDEHPPDRLRANNVLDNSRRGRRAEHSFATTKRLGTNVDPSHRQRWSAQESTWHRDAMNFIEQVLSRRDSCDYFVGGNMFIYFSEEHEESRLSWPRFLRPCARSVSPLHAVWQENPYPDVIVELLSETTKLFDRTTRRVYDYFSDAQYFLYDPDTRTLEGFLRRYQYAHRAGRP